VAPIEKYLFRLTLLTLLLAGNRSAVAQHWIWAKEAVPSNSPQGLGDVFGDHSVALDPAGNSFMTGMVHGTLNFGSSILTCPDYESYLVKYNASGNVLWARQSNTASSISANPLCYSYGVATDNSGNAYIAGQFADTIRFAGNILRTSTLTSFLTKYDGQGHVIWARQSVAGMNGSGGAKGVAVDNAGNIYIAGVFTGSIRFGSVQLSQPVFPGTTCAFLVKYDPNGNVLWARQSVESAQTDVISTNSISIDPAGAVYFTGGSSGTHLFGTQSLNSVKQNAYLAKYDGSGNCLWVTNPTISDTLSIAEGTSVAIDRYGYAYLTGNFLGDLHFGTTHLSAPRLQGNNIFLSKYDSWDKPVWAKQSTNIVGNTWISLAVATDTLASSGGFLLWSCTQTFADCKVTFGTDTFDFQHPANTDLTANIIMSFDSTGQIGCGSIYSEGSENDGDGLCADRSGRYAYITGDLAEPTRLGQDSLFYGQDDTYWALWSCSESKAPTQKPTGLLAIPNVFSPNGDGINDVFLITSEGSIDFHLRIYDRWGVLMFETRDPANAWNGDTKNGMSASDGTYYYLLLVTNPANQEETYKGFLTLFRG
jgi:gliding motility-associated-like protein